LTAAMTHYWINCTLGEQDYWVQRQIDHPVSKHAFRQEAAFFDETSACQVMMWLRTQGATDVHRWPADWEHTPLVEGEHWMMESVTGVGSVIMVAVVHQER